MTHVLRDALGGNSNTLMIANIWGEKEHIEETISTLRFATRMMCVTVNPEVNIHYDPLALIKKYEREILELKQELSMYDTLSNRSHVHYEIYSDIQRNELTKQVKHYIENESHEIEIINIRQIKEIFSIFKSLIRNAEARSAPKDLAPAREVAHEEPTVFNLKDNEGVGDMESSGFGVGLAPSFRRAQESQRKAVKISAKKSRLPSRGGNNDINEEDNIDDEFIIDPVAGQNGSKKGESLSRAEEFELFKKGKGSEMNKNLLENKATLKSKKKTAKEMAESINALKTQIDSLKERLEKKKEVHADDADAIVVDEEEFAMISSLRASRDKYKISFAALKTLRSEIEYCQKLVDQCRQQNLAEFEHWLESRYANHVEMDANDKVSATNVGYFGYWRKV
jgi:kinesin family protein 6/9